jgi:DNA-binding transcriptional MerR regulator
LEGVVERYMKVSEAARRLQCSAEWLREAEKRGKIPRARRDLNGWRVYTTEDVRRLEEILAPQPPEA